MTDNESKSAPSAFDEFDSAVAETSRFLGVVPKRYVRTIHGMTHGLASLGSLVLGNYFYMMQVVLGHNKNNNGVDLQSPNILKTTFWSLTILSATVTIFFFWNKVQSWQLSTTTMKEKGLVSKQMQNFNRGRGTLALLNYSLFPLITSTAPTTWLESRVVLTALSMATLAISWKTFLLIRDYGKILFLVYGMYPGLVALVALTYPNLSTFLQTNPAVMVHFENQACFVISCIQFGFLWYYAYSRRLISKATVQDLCKYYHPILFFVYTGIGLSRSTEQGGWNFLFLVSSSRGLPWPILCHSILITLFAFLFAFKILKTQLKNGLATTTPPLSSTQSPGTTTTTTTTTKQQRRRRSSLFEAEGLQTRRRSSAFEQIAELDPFISSAVSSITATNTIRKVD